MEETNDVTALEKISSEVDESQIMVVLSNQCIKAQAFLLEKLKKQAERHKEACGFINSANLKLEAELKQAQLEINSMMIAHETIKSSNVEIKKEWLVAKERKVEIIKRIEKGKKRYEALWLESKARFESIPFVQKLLKARERIDVLNNETEGVNKQITSLYEEMDTKREVFKNIDTKRCIELANFIVYEIPNAMKIINEKNRLIKDITNQNKKDTDEQNIVNAINDLEEKSKTLKLDELKEDIVVKPNDTNKLDDDPLIPKLELSNFDLDLDVDLEQVKIKKDKILNSISMSIDPIHIERNKIEYVREEGNSYEYLLSPYFKPHKESDSHNFAKRKLINILEDIHINNNEAYNIVKKVNPENLRQVTKISSELVANDTEAPLKCSEDKGKKPLESDDIEEVDMTCSSAADIIIPPTQFLDITLSDGTSKKRVLFDIPPSIQINEIEDEQKQTENDEIVPSASDQTVNSQLDVSVASEEDSFMKIKDMILKKHNLDLSPQFVYTKNCVLQKNEDDKIVTSKFFKKNDQDEAKTGEKTDTRMEVEGETKVNQADETRECKITEQQISLKDNIIPMEVDDMIVSSPKENTENEKQIQRSEKSVSGLLFTHGTMAIPDSLNASISTTGFEDSDFPHCMDSSLLLSPKAVMPVVDGDHSEILSQEVPNFLSGFRKTGLSFFGGGGESTSESKPHSSAQNAGNSFSFNFGGEKKNRGGLFSLFQ